MTDETTLLRGLDFLATCILSNAEHIKKDNTSNWMPDCAFALDDIIEKLDSSDYPKLHELFKMYEAERISILRSD